MGTALVVFVLAVANLSLGYALAVYLGYGPANLWEAWEALTAEEPAENVHALIPPLAPAALTDSAGAPAAAGSSVEEGMDIQPRVESYEEDLPESLAPDDPENWDLNEKYIETSVLKLNIAMMKSGARATQLDTRLRACRGRSDLETIRKCHDDLMEDCQMYLAEQSEAAAQFRNRIGELGELAALGEEIETANLEQTAQIESTLSNLRHMDFESDLESANLRLLEEIKNLRIARHRLRDSQEAAFLTIVAYENRLDKIEKRLYTDPLTRLYNRIGLVATLQQWWQEQRPKTRQMSAVLFDLDAFGRINDEHGPAIGDRLLCQLARLIEGAIGQADLVGRFAGQRFLVIMVDIGPRVAVRNAEWIRQSVERTTFLHEDKQLAVTLSGGVTEITPDDEPDRVFKRVDEAVAAAKQAGRNCVCFHDGKRTEAIHSPNLGAKYNEVRI